VWCIKCRSRIKLPIRINTSPSRSEYGVIFPASTIPDTPYSAWKKANAAPHTRGLPPTVAASAIAIRIQPSPNRVIGYRISTESSERRSMTVVLYGLGGVFAIEPASVWMHLQIPKRSVGI
jgi:hypothetical protein